MPKSRSLDMTQGALLPMIISFSVPLILTNLLMAFFHMADSFVIGRFGLPGSIGAVGATGYLVNLITNLFFGISMGAGVLTARSLGEKNEQKVSESVHCAMPVSIICGVVLTLAGVILSRVFLLWLNTPPDILDRSALYLRIYFLGQLANMVYCFAAAILRAAGESSKPLLFLTLSGALNILLNLLFVIPLKMDVAGVAWGTAISNLLSAFLAVRELMTRDDIIRFDPGKMKIRKKPLLYMLKIGVPSGLNGAMYSFSNVIIQSSMNSFGSEALSGLTAAHNIEKSVNDMENAFVQTSMNFCAQNVGAGDYGRVRKSVLLTMLCAVAVGLFFGVGLYLLAPALLKVYLKDATPYMLEVGVTRMAWVCRFYALMAVLNVMMGALRGIGASTTSFVISMIGACGVRILWNYTVFEKYHTVKSLFTAFPVSWVITAVIEIAAFAVLLKRAEKGRETVTV
ncbi:MAG: MATE family efflux transporter [Clostridia bacterium]|nr:MATE family efflux transporter [Clostridia bacterium]